MWYALNDPLASFVFIYCIIVWKCMLKCVDLQYDEISLAFTAGSVFLYGVCNYVVVFGLSVRLLYYPMWMRWLL